MNNFNLAIEFNQHIYNKIYALVVGHKSSRIVNYTFKVQLCAFCQHQKLKKYTMYFSLKDDLNLTLIPDEMYGFHSGLVEF